MSMLPPIHRPISKPTREFSLISREEMRQLCEVQGLSDGQIAQMYSVTPNVVNQRRQKYNLAGSQPKNVEQIMYVAQLADSVKRLPAEALVEIQEIVQRYQ